MAITITLAAGETFTLDESGGPNPASGLQNGADGTPDPGARPDSDVDISTLPAAFYNYLYGAGAGELNLDGIDASYLSFPTAVGVASSSTTFIRVQTDVGVLSSLGLTNSTGDPFTGTTTLNATSSGIWTTSGKEIFLVSDDVGGVDNQVILGKYDSDGDDTLDAVAFAVYMKTDGTLGNDEYVQLWSVTFTALDHPLAGDGTPVTEYDDAVDLLSLVSITGTGSQTFNFDNMPSGANLFGAVADDPDGVGLFVFGRTPVMNDNGKYTNASDVIHTSQGGLFATIGVNNQMFDPGEGAYFTFVNNIDNDFLGGFKPGGLTPTEADDGDNLQYGSLQDSSGAFIGLSQGQGNSLATMKITAYHLDSNFQGRALIAARGGDGDDQVNIVRVIVYDANGNKIEDTGDLGNYNHADIEVTFSSGSATVSNLAAGYLIEWHTDGDHNQVLIEGVVGKFDVGSFGMTEGAEKSQSVAGRAFVEDDGPAIGDIQNSTIAFAAGTTGNVALGDLEGTDGEANLEITSFTSSFVILGKTIEGQYTDASTKTEVKYFEDKNNNDILDAGDVHWYTLSITQNGNGDDYYKFDIINAPPAPVLEFNFAGLPSGQNLFGAVAQAGAPEGPGVLFHSSAALIKDPGNGEMDKGSGTINTSQGGGPTTIGSNNQMIDPGEGIFFTIVNDPGGPSNTYLANVAGGLDQNEADDADNMVFGSLREVPGAFMRISQTQGNEDEACTIEAFNITSSGGRGLLAASGLGHVDITYVAVYNGSYDPSNPLQNLVEKTVGGADGGMSSVGLSISGGIASVTGLEAGYIVVWETSGNHDQVLVTGTAGKFDIGGFGLTQPQVTPDHNLNFEVTITDGDGDTAKDTFQISIDA